MSNLGFLRLRVVNPFEASFREARSGVGAAPVLASAEEYKSVADAVADCSLVVGTTAVRHRELQHPLKLLPLGAPIIRKRLRYGGRVALLFGSEKRGLSNDDFSHCDWLMRIPTNPQQPSTNLGQAVAVCLYEISRATKLPVAHDREQAAKSADLERLIGLLHDLLMMSGYAKKKDDRGAARRLVRRLKLSSADTQLLLGMLRQMLWKMPDS